MSSTFHQPPKRVFLEPTNAPKTPTACTRSKLGRAPWLLIYTWGSARIREFAIPTELSTKLDCQSTRRASSRRLPRPKPKPKGSCQPNQQSGAAEWGFGAAGRLAGGVQCRKVAVLMSTPTGISNGGFASGVLFGVVVVVVFVTLPLVINSRAQGRSGTT